MYARIQGKTWSRCHAGVIAGGWALGGVLGAFLSHEAINGLLFSMPDVGLAIGVALI